MKHLGINLRKDVKNLYMENYKSLWTEIKEDQKRKIKLCSQIARLNMVKIVVSLN